MYNVVSRNPITFCLMLGAARALYIGLENFAKGGQYLILLNFVCHLHFG